MKTARFPYLPTTQSCGFLLFFFALGVLAALLHPELKECLAVDYQRGIAILLAFEAVQLGSLHTFWTVPALSFGFGILAESNAEEIVAGTLYEAGMKLLRLFPAVALHFLLCSLNMAAFAMECASMRVRPSRKKSALSFFCMTLIGFAASWLLFRSV